MSHQERFYAVRCCCKPNKIFGFLRLPHLYSMTGTVEHHRVIDIHGNMHTIQIKSMSHYMGGSTGIEQAIHSEDRPIEFWRALNGFIEAVPEQVERYTYINPLMKHEDAINFLQGDFCGEGKRTGQESTAGQSGKTVAGSSRKSAPASDGGAHDPP